MNSKWAGIATLGCALSVSLAAFSGIGDAEAAKGPWLIRGRALAVMPDESASVTVLGGNLRFGLGRRFAPSLYGTFPRLAPWLALGAAAVERYGLLLLPLYRYAKGSFTLISVGAGASPIAWRRFLALDLLGAAAWTGSWVMTGAAIAAAGSQLDPRWAAYVGLGLLACGMFAVAIGGRHLKRVLLPHANRALAAATAARQPAG